MVETDLFLNQAADYVLDLLPSGQRQQFEAHAAVCPQCRQAVSRESQLGRLVRSTLASAAEVDQRRLRQLMPPAPRRRAPIWQRAWQKQLAPAAVALVLLLGGWGLWQSNQAGGWATASPTYQVVTATMTELPTATLAETAAVDAQEMPYQAVATIPLRTTMPAEPAPAPTPQIGARKATVANQP